MNSIHECISGQPNYQKLFPSYFLPVRDFLYKCVNQEKLRLVESKPMMQRICKSLGMSETDVMASINFMKQIGDILHFPHSNILVLNIEWFYRLITALMVFFSSCFLLVE